MLAAEERVESTEAGTEVVGLISGASVGRDTDNHLTKQSVLLFNDEAPAGITDGPSVRAVSALSVTLEQDTVCCSIFLF